MRAIAAAIFIFFLTHSFAGAEWSWVEASFSEHQKVIFENPKIIGGVRILDGASKTRMQAISIHGNADDPDEVNSWGDLRGANYQATTDFLEFTVDAVLTSVLSEADLPTIPANDAKAFVSKALKSTKVGGKSSKTFGPFRVELDRTSDVMAIVRMKRVK